MTVRGDEPEVTTLDVPVERLLPLARLRHWVAAKLSDLDEEHLRALLLVLTELVTNVHDHTPGPHRVRLRRTRTPCIVRVEVDDASSDMPTVGSSRLGTHRGRGLVLVRELSESWGVERLAESGKTLWAVTSCGAAGGSADRRRPDGVPRWL